MAVMGGTGFRKLLEEEDVQSLGHTGTRARTQEQGQDREGRLSNSPGGHMPRDAHSCPPYAGCEAI